MHKTQVTAETLTAGTTTGIMLTICMNNLVGNFKRGSLAEEGKGSKLTQVHWEDSSEFKMFTNPTTGPKFAKCFKWNDANHFNFHPEFQVCIC